jgi:tyrosinase
MWWRWQQSNLAIRGQQYLGVAETNTTRKSSLEDLMPMGGLAPDVQVSHVMSTDAGLLCYGY